MVPAVSSCPLCAQQPANTFSRWHDSAPQRKKEDLLDFYFNLLQTLQKSECPGSSSSLGGNVSRSEEREVQTASWREDNINSGNCWLQPRCADHLRAVKPSLLLPWAGPAWISLPGALLEFDGTGGGNILIDSLSAVIGTRVVRRDHGWWMCSRQVLGLLRGVCRAEGCHVYAESIAPRIKRLSWRWRMTQVGASIG